MGVLGKIFMLMVTNFKRSPSFDEALRLSKEEGYIFAPEFCLLALGIDIGLKYLFLRDSTLTNLFLILIFFHFSLWVLTMGLTVIPRSTTYRIHLNNAVGVFSLSTIIVPLLVLLSGQ